MLSLLLRIAIIACMRNVYPFIACRRSRRSAGFTLVEVLLTITVLSVLSAIAMPSFTGLMERYRVRQSFEGLQSALYFARSEAIKRGGNVFLQRAANNTNGCTTATTNSDWDCGWFVFVNADGKNAYVAGSDTLLQTFATPARVQVARSVSEEYIQFDRWGMPDKAFGFAFVPLNKSTSDQAALGLCMSRGGRIRKAAPQDIPCNND